MKSRSSFLSAFFLALAVASRSLTELFGSLALIVIYVAFIGSILFRLKKLAAAEPCQRTSIQLAMMIAYLAILLFNIFTSQARYYSEHDAVLIAVMPIAFIAFSLSNGARLIRVAPAEFVWPAAAIALLGIAQTQIEGIRAQATFLDINSFAAFMYLALLPTAGHLMASRRHWFYWPFLILLCLALSVADSRGAYLASGIGIILLCVIGVILKMSRRRIAAVVATILLSCSIGATTLAVKRDVTFLQTVGSPVQTLRTDTVSIHSRFWMWESALRAYKTEAPIFGTGLGTYKLVYPQYRDPREKYSSGDQAHNDYVQWLLEGGPLLLIGLIMVGVVMPIVLLVRGIRKSASDLSSAWPAIYFSVTCLAVAGHATINFLYKDPVIALLVGTYLAISACLTAAVSPSHSASTISKFSKFAPAGIALAAGFLAVTLSINTAIQFLFVDPNSGSHNWTMQKTYSTAALAHLFNSSNPYPLNALSLVSFKQALATEPGDKRTALLKASYADTNLWIEANRREPFAWMRSADIAEESTAVTKGAKPEDFLSIAAAYDPTSLLVNSRLSQRLLDIGQVEESCSEIRNGEKWVPVEANNSSLKKWAETGLLACKANATADEIAIWKSIASQPW